MELPAFLFMMLANALALLAWRCNALPRSRPNPVPVDTCDPRLTWRRQ